MKGLTHLSGDTDNRVIAELDINRLPFSFQLKDNYKMYFHNELKLPY